MVKEKLSVNWTSFRSSCLKSRLSLSTLQLFQIVRHTKYGLGLVFPVRSVDKSMCSLSHPRYTLLSIRPMKHQNSSRGQFGRVRTRGQGSGDLGSGLGFITDFLWTWDKSLNLSLLYFPLYGRRMILITHLAGEL